MKQVTQKSHTKQSKMGATGKACHTLLRPKKQHVDHTYMKLTGRLFATDGLQRGGGRVLGGFGTIIPTCILYLDIGVNVQAQCLLLTAGSARAGSRQNSESADPVQAMMDEAVEAATAAAAAAVTNATESQAMDIEAATVSHAGLPGRDSGDSQLRGSDSQLRGSSPDAVVPMSELPVEPLRGTPVRGVDPSRAVTPQPRSNTPPPSHPPSWGPADGIRYRRRNLQASQQYNNSYVTCPGRV